MSKKMLSQKDVKLYNAQVDMTKSVYSMMKQLATMVMNGAKKTKTELAPEAKEIFQTILDYQVDLDHLKPEEIFTIRQMYNTAMAVFTKLAPKEGEK